ncbi:hypothetical protein EB118_12780 [bacterium]|nr:hypothetical protein [bacterium]
MKDRESVTVDLELLHHLLANNQPVRFNYSVVVDNLITELSTILKHSEDDFDIIPKFKAVIYREYLNLQLMDASFEARDVEEVLHRMTDETACWDGDESEKGQ